MKILPALECKGRNFLLLYNVNQTDVHKGCFRI